MEVHFEFFEEQEWLSLCLREEEMHFLRAGVWEGETEFDVLFAAGEMIGKRPQLGPRTSQSYGSKGTWITGTCSNCSILFSTTVYRCTFCING